MNLTIEKNQQHVSDKDGTFVMDTSMLNAQATHMFIASNAWDTVTVELNDSIPRGYLKYIPTVAQKICVRINEPLNSTTISQLCELYPDKAGILRRLFMAQKDVTQALPECAVV